MLSITKKIWFQKWFWKEFSDSESLISSGGSFQSQAWGFKVGGSCGVNSFSIYLEARSKHALKVISRMSKSNTWSWWKEVRNGEAWRWLLNLSSDFSQYVRPKKVQKVGTRCKMRCRLSKPIFYPVGEMSGLYAGQFSIQTSLLLSQV